MFVIVLCVKRVQEINGKLYTPRVILRNSTVHQSQDKCSVSVVTVLLRAKALGPSFRQRAAYYRFAGAFVISLCRMNGRLLETFSSRTIVVECEGWGKEEGKFGFLSTFYPNKIQIRTTWLHLLLRLCRGCANIFHLRTDVANSD